MLKIATIIGARPQFIKAAAISNTINSKYSNRIKEIIIHSGQHYDYNMSEVFFKELVVPIPKYHLNIGSDTHAQQTGKMIISIEKTLLECKPDVVLVYGDTNTTLSASLAGTKLKIPVIHVEAGLRSFNKLEPEELNRILTDHVSTFLFCPTEKALDNLKNEGFKRINSSKTSINNPFMQNCGDVMYDLFLQQIDKNEVLSKDISSLPNKPFFLTTIHRAGNILQKNRIEFLLQSLIDIVNEFKFPILFPLHPSTKKQIDLLVNDNLKENFYSTINVISPLSYLETLNVLSKATLVLTDSGGLQKEAYFSKKACVVLRSETEWIELIENKFAYITTDTSNSILTSVSQALNVSIPERSSLYGNGNACDIICESLLNELC